MLRILFSGESHGTTLSSILEGLPAGIPLCAEEINQDLMRRQKGYGRGSRMKIEHDSVEIVSGVRHGFTLGSPVCLLIRNLDHENWKEIMSCRPAEDIQAVTAPRPGHADLAGALKYGFTDLRNVLERASARETAARTAAGSVCKKLLSCFGISISSRVTAIGGISSETCCRTPEETESSSLRCSDPAAEIKMMQLIDQARENGESLGGVVEINVSGCFPGLGSHVQPDRRLDAMLAGTLMSIPSVKAVEIGDGISGSAASGSLFHDEIISENGKIRRKTNHAGGIEGGVSNGETIRIRLFFKPIPTLTKPLDSIDLISKKPVKACRERSDVCAVPAGGVVAEAETARVLAGLLLEKFGNDNLDDLKLAVENYKKRIGV